MLTQGPFNKAAVAGRLVTLSAAGGLLAAALVLPAVGAAGIMTRTVADKFNDLKTTAIGELPVRSEIMDSGGHLIAYYYPKGIDREPVAYDQIAPVMRQAIVAIEDSRFYQHGAIDFRGTMRALVNDAEHKAVQGGSTLTQQYVKNALILTAPDEQQALTASEDTVSRKIKELKLAIQVEKQMSKNDIVAGYLNVAFFGTFDGNQAVGIGAAAERYFDTTAAQLTLPEAALLAGMVENPSLYDPVTNPTSAIIRRNTVLARMVQVHDITQAQATAAEKTPLGLHQTALQTGCTSNSAHESAFFCDYVVSVLRQDSTYSKAWNILNTTGGLQIYTTLSRKDQDAATHAVNYMVPPPPSIWNPNGNLASEVLIQPGTGHIMAIANSRTYGNAPHQTLVDYAVNTRYDGSPDGVQTGSSSKLFTLLTALEQGVPFGSPMTVGTPATVNGFSNCEGDPVAPWSLVNDSPSEKGAFTLYTATEQSVNVYFAMLERKVGLCNVVKTAADLGVTWVNGTPLLDNPRLPGNSVSADNLPSFTLGAAAVSPMSMAAAYAAVAARGMYCHPVAIASIATRTGDKLPVESANCRQAIPASVADAASYVLQSVLSGPTGTASGLGIGRPDAGKTGTSDNFDYAAFAGYTPDLAGYVSVFNPVSASQHPMSPTVGDCYRLECPGDSGGMFGADAPAHTWQMTFENVSLANPPLNFQMSDINPELFSMGNGQTNPKKGKGGNGKGGNGGGGNGGGGNGGGGNGGGGNGGGGGGGGNGGGGGFPQPPPTF